MTITFTFYENGCPIQTSVPFDNKALAQVDDLLNQEKQYEREGVASEGFDFRLSPDPESN